MGLAFFRLLHLKEREKGGEIKSPPPTPIEKILPDNACPECGWLDGRHTKKCKNHILNMLAVEA